MPESHAAGKRPLDDDDGAAKGRLQCALMNLPPGPSPVTQPQHRGEVVDGRFPLCPACGTASLERPTCFGSSELRCTQCGLQFGGLCAGPSDVDVFTKIDNARQRHASHGGAVSFTNAGPRAPALHYLRSDDIVMDRPVVPSPLVPLLDDIFLWASCTGCGATELVV